MTSALRAVARGVVRWAILWLVDAVSLWLVALILPGISLVAVGSTPAFVVAIAAALLLSIVNLFIRPLVMLIARPLGFVVLILIGFVVNALTLMLTARLVAGFDIDGFLMALVGGIIFAAINAVFTGVLEVDQEGSFYQNRIERRARRTPYAGASEPGRGLVMLEIDGLSIHHLKKALADGHLPYLSRLMEEEGYTFTRVDCGLPSQTSACQAGIMFGDNYDIPAFRWYDKDEGKLYVSSMDAEAINARYAHGKGLMRGGGSINNMLSGDAEKSLLTLGDLRNADKEQRRRRAQDIYLLLLDPYFFMRSVAFLFGGVARELWQGWRQKRRGETPRMNRLHEFYPFVRAATCELLRDVAVNLTIMDIMRGAPAVYTTYVGYDEVAHHSGTWSKDAFGELARYNQAIERVHRVIQEKAPRPYDLIILSDHGQSLGSTFLQRYGMSLKEFIESLLPAGTTVAQSVGGDTGVTTLGAASGELANIQDEGVGGGLGRAVARQGEQYLAKGAERDQPDPLASPANVTAYGSGNLAQVYFDLEPRRLLLPELEAAYPGAVDALVAHEGIGFVGGYAADGAPVVLGKGGSRNLVTGEVDGEDPLVSYAASGEDAVGAASTDTRAWQVKRVMDFPHAGDLMVVSTVYPDGTVAALEELIGSHGGLGGEQTDAFIFHPGDMPVPPTRNSADVFAILDARRGTPVAPPAEEVEAAAASVSAWSPANLLAGTARVDRWVGRALRCLILDRSAYRDVAADASMTGPAVLLAIIGALVASVAREGEWSWQLLLARFGLWILAALVVFAAGWLLTKQGNVTRTMRVVGFAQVAVLLELLTFIPTVAPLGRFLAVVVMFFGTWLGAAEAHKTRGWRTLVLPVLAVAVLVVGIWAMRVLVEGGTYTLDTLLNDFGAQGN